jgi:hypothetical protein
MKNQQKYRRLMKALVSIGLIAPIGDVCENDIRPKQLIRKETHFKELSIYSVVKIGLIRSKNVISKA